MLPANGTEQLSPEQRSVIAFNKERAQFIRLYNNDNGGKQCTLSAQEAWGLHYNEAAAMAHFESHRRHCIGGSDIIFPSEFLDMLRMSICGCRLCPLCGSPKSAKLPNVIAHRLPCSCVDTIASSGSLFDLMSDDTLRVVFGMLDAKALGSVVLAQKRLGTVCKELLLARAISYVTVINDSTPFTQSVTAELIRRVSSEECAVAVRRDRHAVAHLIRNGYTFCHRCGEAINVQFKCTCDA